MAIAIFAGGPQGQQGPIGPANDRDINSMIMLAWMGGDPIVRGYDLYTNNFSNSKGIDPSSVAAYNPAGYYSTPIANTLASTTVNFSSSSDIYRLNKQGSIYRWVQDNNLTGHFEGATYTLISGGVAVNKGGGKVGLPCTSQPYATGQFIEVRGTTNYNATFTVDATSGANEIVVPTAYNSETFGNTATVNQRITIGSGNYNPNTISGSVVEFPSSYAVIINITGSGYRFGETQLSSYQPTGLVTGIYDTYVSNNTVMPGSFYSTTSSGWYTVTSGGPQNRYGAGMAYDSNTKGIWLFGGYSTIATANLNDLWKYSTISGQWTQYSPPSSPTARYGHSLVYDPVNNNLIMWGGFVAAANAEMWKYSIASGTWTQQTFAGGPSARYLHSAAYMPASGTILLFAGTTGSTQNDLWEYTISTNIWRQMSLSGPPAVRHSAGAVCQTVSGALIIAGGFNNLVDVWKLEYANTGNPNKWVQLTSSPTGAAMYMQTTFYDDVNDKLFTIGGNAVFYIYRYDFKSTWTNMSPALTPFRNNTNQPCGAYDSDAKICYTMPIDATYPRSSFWSYTIATNNYTDVLPDMRYGAAMSFVKPRNKIYLMFGVNTYNATPYNDIWQFDCVTKTWSRLNPSTAVVTTTVPKYNMSAVYSSVIDAILLFSGATQNLNDLWKYDFVTSNWIQLYPTGVSPTYRSQYGSAYDTEHDRWYLFGGTGAAAYAELWYYDVKANSWVQVAYLGNAPSTRQGHSMVYDSINKCFWVFGGLYSATYYNTLYKYDIASNVWSLVMYTGSAISARTLGTMVFDYNTQSLLLWGGWDGSTRFNSFYRYDIRTNVMYTVSANAALPLGKTNAPSVYNDITGDMYIFGGYITAIPYVTSDLTAYNLWDIVTQSNIPATTTSGVQLNTKTWTGINSIVPVAQTPGASYIYHAISFDNRTTYSAFTTASGWFQIAKNNAGTWQYRDANAVWQNATTNDVTTALQQAMTISGNRLPSSSLQAITSSQYSQTGGFSAGIQTLDFGMGFDCPYNYMPNLGSYTVNYSSVGSNMTLITETWSASANNPVTALCLLNITSTGSVVLDTDLQAWVSMDGGVNYDQITGLSVLRTVGNNQYIKGINTTLTARGNNQMKFKIVTYNNKTINVYGIGVALRYY